MKISGCLGLGDRQWMVSGVRMGTGFLFVEVIKYAQIHCGNGYKALWIHWKPSPLTL